MLTIHAATSAAAVKSYFDVADYYTEGQETIGQWGGKLAEQLGLSGTVDKYAFERLCDNSQPFSNQPLTQRTNDNRRVGYDMVFSGPKSFSILEAFASEEVKRLLLAAFDRSVNETMREAEGDMQTRVRLDGAFHDRPTGNMVWAAFDHSTARPVPKPRGANDNSPRGTANDNHPPDMHRHRHVFVFNATYDAEEDRIKAGEFSYIKRDGEYYTAVFYAKLAHQLEGMGFAIDRKGGKEWEIAGVPESMIDTFSKRTGQVEDIAELLGIEDGERKSQLGATTRAGKAKELTQSELRAAWDAQVTDDERDELGLVYANAVPGSTPVTASEAVAFAIAHLSEQLSVFPERELKRVALLHGLGHVLPEQLEAELPRHGVITGRIDGRVMATTKALQDEERYIVSQAARGCGAARPVGVADGLSHTLADGKSLSDEQWAVTTGLLESSNRVSLVQGPAGAGKSFSLRKFEEGLNLAGQHGTYLATTAKAAKLLADDGFAAKTVAHFLLDEKMQAAAGGGRVVIDEASMLGHKDAVKLFQLAEKHDLKLVFVGDPLQHGSVPRGALMRLLERNAGIKPFTISRIQRQQDGDYLAAAQLLSEGRTLEGFDRLDAKGWVEEITGAADRYAVMAAEYVQAVKDKESVLLVSPTHSEAAAITAEIRRQMQGAGLLDTDERAYTRLVQVNASEAERGLATTYRVGDVIQFHQNAKGGFVKGQRIEITDPAAAPVELAGRFSLYRRESVMLAEGDRIRFTGNVTALGGGKKPHVYKNGDAARVAGFTDKGHLKLEDGRVVDAKCGHFRPAWVETSFGAQGVTVDRVILGMAAESTGATNQEQMYTSSTRARHKLSLYTDEKEAVRKAIQRSSQKLAALDVKPEPVAELVVRHDWRKDDAERRRRMRLERETAEATQHQERRAAYGR